MKVMIVVTHLLGTGHLSRALTLGRAFAAQGHRVQLTSGGMPAPQLDSTGVDLVQLPPLRSDGTNFTTLLAADGAVATAHDLQARRDAQCQALRDFTPDVLITELYPFGRRVLADEFLALLDAAHAMPGRPVILSSIRDILAPPSKPSKATRADEIIAQFYDAVLVHSDPQATTLERSWPVSDQLSGKLIYTGYVAPQAPDSHPDQAGAGEILVSAGGGSVGTSLYETAIRAAALQPDLPWRLLGGGADASDRIKTLPAHPGNVQIEPARPDFRQMLRHATASVSMCGYNTALDLLQTGVPSVMVPFDDGKEVEQTLRAQSLAQLPSLTVLRSADLTPETLAQSVAQVIQSGPRADLALNFDGAAQTVAIATRLEAAR
jgi:predicted glycosyltransferase